MKTYPIGPCTAPGCTRLRNAWAPRYCSLKCQRRFIREQRYIKFLNGEEPPNVQVKSFLRWAIIRYIGFEACSRCGWAEKNPVTGRIPVEVEHIDGDWQNNRPENLTLLCPSCHSLTPTYRALNWGRGRARRLGGRANPFRDAVASQVKARVNLRRVEVVLEKGPQLALPLPT